ncbi:hypothetical protein GCM10010472_04140 [Pseudonocardia halophobica]|uniref:Uncharacterized protein n=1 Tax=Pseudonocardia halophobica TaxID=29401 RepID=A0A9W6L521_9PSEU|nr:hypothetical protein [Pseudonocardia halophobica]GLL13373.1 hypothetical protein GCM10017577_45160 [Pseudonocardia halophobica]
MSRNEIPGLDLAIRRLTDSDLRIHIALMHKMGSAQHERGQIRAADVYWAFALVMELEMGRRDELMEDVRRQIEDDTIGEILTEQEAAEIREILARDLGSDTDVA